MLNLKAPIKVMLDGTKPFEGTGCRKALKISTRSICSSCNNVWLSELEKKAKPLLQYIISGEMANVPEYFDSDAQEQIAVWATKTMLLLDYTSHYDREYRKSLFDKEELRKRMQDLYNIKKPLADTKVWISATKTRNPIDKSEHRLLAYFTGHRFDNGSVLSTLTIASLVIQICFQESNNIGNLTPPYPFSSVLTPLSPQLMPRIFFLPKKCNVALEPSELDGLSTWRVSEYKKLS